MRTVLLLVLLPFSTLIAQEPFPHRDSLLSTARNHLKTLTSEVFYGRGYQQNGHKIAADFLEEKFRKYGLKPIGGSYQQPFSFKLNVVEKASLTLNQKDFKAGTDFIVNAQSGAGMIDLKVVDLDHALKIKEKARNHIVVFREGLPESIQNDPRKRELYAEKGRDDYKLTALSKFSPAAVVILRKKLTASLRPESLPFPIVELEQSAYPTQKVKLGIVEVDAEIKTIETQNVLGYLQGTGNTDSVILVTAHYDHLGGYSGAIFTGANDNASGTSMLLSMAEHFAQNPPKYDMLFIAFGAEEAGLQGSAHYVMQNPLIPLEKMKFILNLDLMGNGDEGIMAVGGKDFPGQFDILKDLNDSIQAVPRVRARQNAPNSDHYFFLKNGVPGFFIYTMGGPSHYHDVKDTNANLLFSKYVEVRQLLIAFLENL